jgi:hypothetical protein
MGLTLIFFMLLVSSQVDPLIQVLHFQQPGNLFLD